MTGQAEPFGPCMEKWTWPTGEVQVLFHCPGCGGTHAYWLSQPEGHSGPIWHLSGTKERPTLDPSLRVRGASRKGKEYCCHLFIRNGLIEYCGDSTHELAGKTVPMEAYP